ncbi:hypothetical protein [Sphingomonas sanguinis]|uniref:hypothetical protein n=1 Tax=Sphingomonas sanguinis TaxID=33051 RepID=UPI000AA84855|nr:hypothetical protein [Sphingomonas sanguinis]
MSSRAIRNGWPLAPGARAVAPAGPAWVFGPSAFKTVGAALYLMGAGDATRLTELADVYLPPQPAGWRVVFVNFGLDSNTRAPGYARELFPGNVNTLDYVASFTGAGGTGTRTGLTFSGATSTVMSDGGFAISDPVATAFPGGFLRYSITTPGVGASRPRGLTSMSQFGELRRHLAAPDMSKAAGGAINGVGVTANTSNGYSPVAVLVPWSRQPSVLEIGDSITQQDDITQLASARGMVGGITRGLDDDGVTGRFGVGNFGHHGAQMIDFMSLADGRFGLRYRLLANIRNVINGGQVWPFSAIWSQGLRNDFSAMSYPNGTDPAVVVADMQARAATWWDFLAKSFPGVPIVQSTITPRTTDSTTARTSLAAQAGNGLPSQAPLQAVNNWIMTQPSPLALSVDLRPAYQAPDDGTGTPKWKLTAIAAAGGAPLATALAVGVDIGGVGLRLTSPLAPVPGEYAVFEPGTANMEIGPQIGTSIVNNNDGSFTVKTAGSYTIKRAHAAGSIVSTTHCSDGTHPGSGAQQAASAPVIASKPALVLATA